MSNTKLNQGHGTNQSAATNNKTFARTISKLILAALAVLTVALLVPAASAQTLTLTPTNNNLFVGGGTYSGTYSNFQIRALVASPSATVPFALSAVTPPAGVTVSFSTNNFTNTQVVTLSVAVANVAKGTYALTIQGMSNAVIAYTTNFNLIVGTRWTNQSAANVNWSTGSSWSGGAPGSTDEVMFQDGSGPNNNTNYVDASTTVSSLTYIRSLSGTNHNTAIAPGATLSVLGANGFAVNVDSTTANNKTTTVNISGGAGSTLLVSNSAANFTINSDNTGGSATTVAMTNLDNLKADVSRFGLGDATMNNQGGVGAQNVVVSLAKTNFIKASFVSDLTGTNFLLFGLSFFNNRDTFNNGSASTVNLGSSNAIFADNIAIGQARCGAGGNIVRFNPFYTNGNAAVAFIRNTNNGRVSLMAVGVDSGDSNPGSNARSTLLFNGGRLDALINELWLGRNRNSTLTNTDALAEGVLTFGPGTVDVNTARLGYNLYTNNSFAQGTINVNSNGLLIVNTTMELGYVAGDYTTTGFKAGQTRGTLMVNGGGVIRAKQIVVRTGSTNNQITLNPNGTLIVSNTIGSAATSLTKMTTDGGSLTLFVNAGVTNVFTTNLTTTVTAGKINIASISGFASYPATNVLIAYQVAASHNLSIGTLPPGFNNLQINDNTANNTIELIINTNAPKNLAWRGGASSQWNHGDLNWLDLNTLTITKFTDGDSVKFDDTAAVPTSIDITENILPGQTGTGVLVTNNVNNYTFNNSGGAIGGTTLVKTGSMNMQLDATTSVSAQVQQGSLTGSGAVGSASVSVGAVMNFSGTDGGALVSSGTTTIGGGGFVNGAVTISAGVATNAGTIQGGSLTIASGTTVYNSGSLKSIGAATVATNATLINAGNIGSGSIANSLTVNGTFKDMGTGTITVDQLSITGTGTFIPGGDGIGTTTVMSTGNGTIPGLVRLLQGSTTLIKVDYNNPQTNTMVLGERFVFGPSHGLPKAQDGCTLSLSNTGIPPYTAGTLKLFGYSGGAGNFFDAGLNTTNSFPVVTPATPGAGLTWDPVTRMLYEGLLQIVGIATNPTNITPTFTVTGSNIVTEISWPADHLGWSLQSLTTTTAVGVTATNWVTIFGSSQTNDLFITNSSPAADAAVFYRLIGQ